MLSRIILTILFLCFILCGFTQSDTSLQRMSPALFSSPVSVFTGKAKQFTADNLGNLYVLNSAGLLIKYNSNGDSLYVFNDVRRYGTIFSIDATNPMKVLVYYRDFSTLVMLDRFLNRINTVDLRKCGIFQAKAVGLAYDNNIWVFDEQSAKLKKVDENGRVLSETPDLRQVLGVAISPSRLLDRDGFVYLYDEDNGLYVFDYYGALKNTLTLKNWNDLQVINKAIVGRKDGQFVRYIPGTLELREEDLPTEIRHSLSICITQWGIYVLNAQGIRRFPFNKNRPYE